MDDDDDVELIHEQANREMSERWGTAYGLPWPNTRDFDESMTWYFARVRELTAKAKGKERR